VNRCSLFIRKGQGSRHSFVGTTHEETLHSVVFRDCQVYGCVVQGRLRKPKNAVDRQPTMPPGPQKRGSSALGRDPLPGPYPQDANPRFASHPEIGQGFSLPLANRGMQR
jgi:hypothetical protein